MPSPDVLYSAVPVTVTWFSAWRLSSRIREPSTTSLTSSPLPLRKTLCTSLLMKSRNVEAPGSLAEKLMTLRLVYPATSGSAACRTSRETS